jgi:hypothetical protein
LSPAHDGIPEPLGTGIARAGETSRTSGEGNPRREPVSARNSTATPMATTAPSVMMAISTALRRFVVTAGGPASMT